MKLTSKQIKKELDELRKFIDMDDTPTLESRIAYSIECAVRFVTEDTDWSDEVDYCLVKEAIEQAEIIKNDLRCQADNKP